MALVTEVLEESSLLVGFNFKDSLGVSVTPTTQAWQLMYEDGTVVGTNTFANGSFSGNYFVISGSALALASDGNRKRIVAIEGTYTSSYGSDLPFTVEKEFMIKNKRAA